MRIYVFVEGLLCLMFKALVWNARDLGSIASHFLFLQVVVEIACVRRNEKPPGTLQSTEARGLRVARNPYISDTNLHVP